MSTTKITVSTVISAGIQKVWDYWTQPGHITHWNFASDDWHCPKAENDLKNGGKFNYTMASRDGSMSFGFEGVYDEVTPHEKIAYTLLDDREVVIRFETDGETTRVTETFDAENMNSRELQQTGWQAILDNFKNYVESSQ